MRSRLILVAGLAVVASACGRLGVGVPECEVEVRDPTTATILALQAVPTAAFSPCVSELKLGWDDLEFEAERGRSKFTIRAADLRAFLTVTLTESCEVGEARESISGHRGITKYVDVQSVPHEVLVTLVPLGDGPLAYARDLAQQERRALVDLEDRPVAFRVDSAVDEPVTARVERATGVARFVWIVNEIDVAEGTVELRWEAHRAGARGVSVAEALDIMEDRLPDVAYKGHWYFTFEGGCVTYEFDAEGAIAETVASDAREALGFYPAADLRRIGEDMGYEF